MSPSPRHSTEANVYVVGRGMLDEVAKKRGQEKRGGNVNRLLLRRWSTSGVEDRLWDRNGRLWRLYGEDLTMESVERLYFNPDVPVAIYESASTLRWVDPPDRRANWAELSARAFGANWQPPTATPGALSFVAQEWRSGDDRLLLFDDRD